MSSPDYDRNAWWPLHAGAPGSGRRDERAGEIRFR